MSLCLSILLAAFVVVVVVNSTHPLSGMVFCGSNVASSGHMRRFFCKPPLSSFGVSHWQTLESLRLFLLIITGEEREREREREEEDVSQTFSRTTTKGEREKQNEWAASSS